MKTNKYKKSILLKNLKPVSGGKAVLIDIGRINSSETFSFLFYKPISKFEILDNEKNK
ncbi:hypothetical protein KB553_01045 [Chryseobacterium rhizoplanae]|uniref:hypothetical protein n=1 Tax=Chryseobacterium rhizoplanae TaxID=1609531 RepID=UPI001CE3B4BA|nr:hypothetical protein [Chryseobacterium rhizoplanae]UCA60130.1 hypothetical protein KB553_01045 [Chryseobacterium rhizoplanae]